MLATALVMPGRIKLITKPLPDLLAEVGLGIFAELAFSTLRHIQWDDGVTFENEIKLISILTGCVYQLLQKHFLYLA